MQLLYRGLYCDADEIEIKSALSKITSSTQKLFS